MARWDRELIELLPHSMKVMASAGAGYDWVDVDVLAEYGTSHPSRALGEWGVGKLEGGHVRGSTP